jgi:hypothetical protein
MLLIFVTVSEYIHPTECIKITEICILWIAIYYIIKVILSPYLNDCLCKDYDMLCENIFKRLHVVQSNSPVHTTRILNSPVENTRGSVSQTINTSANR